MFLWLWALSKLTHGLPLTVPFSLSKYEASGQTKAPASLWQACICWDPIRKLNPLSVFKIEEIGYTKLLTRMMEELSSQTGNWVPSELPSTGSCYHPSFGWWDTGKVMWAEPRSQDPLKPLQAACWLGGQQKRRSCCRSKTHPGWDNGLWLLRSCPADTCPPCSSTGGSWLVIRAGSLGSSLEEPAPSGPRAKQVAEECIWGWRAVTGPAGHFTCRNTHQDLHIFKTTFIKV